MDLNITEKRKERGRGRSRRRIRGGGVWGGVRRGEALATKLTTSTLNIPWLRLAYAVLIIKEYFGFEHYYHVTSSM